VTGYPLAGDEARRFVPEPAVKSLLAERGVRVPRAVTVQADAEPDLAGLREPFVVKGFGPGIVHKRDVGALRLGVSRPAVVETMHELAVSLRSRGITVDGFLVEEQHEPGVELLVGVVRGAFGPIVMVALGGSLTEALDRSVARLAPIDRDAATEMLDTPWLRGVLAGTIGDSPSGHESLVSALLTIAGPDGLASSFGGRLREIECNPLAVSADGTVALDARLVLGPDELDEPTASSTDFARLFAPRAVAVAGASTRAPTFGNRFLAAYRDAGWCDHLYAIHPHATEIDGVPAYARAVDVPEQLDYLLVAVPAGACAAAIADTGGRVPFVHVISGGFSEAGDEGRAREGDLLTAATATGTRVLGPNCMGVFAPAGGQTFLLDAPRTAGHVSVISQSGALAGDIVKAGDRRGIRFAKLVTVGNAIDVNAAELLSYLVDDPETHVVGLYLEGSRDGELLVEGLRRAAGRVPVAVLAAGSSAQGAAAAASHTGALAGDAATWSAIAASTGAVVVRTLEDLLAVLSYAQADGDRRTRATQGVLVVGPGGGASVLATDACDRHGLRLHPLKPDVRDTLRELGLDAGTSTANPVELPVGPATGPDAFDAVLDVALGEGGFGDVLVHVNVQSYFSYGVGGIDPLLQLLDHLAGVRTRWTARLAVVLRNVECAPPVDGERARAAVVDAGLPVFQHFDEAAVAIAAAQTFRRWSERVAAGGTHSG
jgi:acyl-CoA synthetase (NDP forming)